MKKLAVALLSIFVLAALFNPSPASAASASEKKYSATATKMTNSERSKRDLKVLKGRACIAKYARKQASRMASAKKIYHQDLGTIMKKCKLKRVGENVASGYSSKKVVRAWMNSSGHRKNILTKPYRRMAIGAKRSSDGRWFVSQVFGTPR